MNNIKKCLLILVVVSVLGVVCSLSAFAYDYPPTSGVDFYLPNWYSSPYNFSSYPNGKWFQFFTVNGNGYPYYIEVCLNSSNLSAFSIYPTLMSDNRICFYVYNSASSAVSISSAHCWIYDGVTNNQISHLTAFGSTIGFVSSNISGANYSSVSVSSNQKRTICFWTSNYSRPYVTSWGGGMISGSGTLHGASYNAPTIMPLNFTVNGSSVIDPDDGSISGGIVISGTYDPDTGAFTFNFPFVDYSNQFTLIVNRQDTIIQRLDSILLALSNLQLDNSEVVEAIEDGIDDIVNYTPSGVTVPDLSIDTEDDTFPDAEFDSDDLDELGIMSGGTALTWFYARLDDLATGNIKILALITSALSLGFIMLVLNKRS